MKQQILDCLTLTSDLGEFDDFEIEIDFDKNQDKYKKLIKARFVNGRIMDENDIKIIDEYVDIILEQVVQLIIDKNNLQKMINKIK